MPIVVWRRPRVRSGVRIACLAAALFDVRGAQAAEGNAGLEVPAGCGSDVEFARELQRLLGAQAADARPKSVRIEASVDTGYRLRLALADEVRELQHPDCRTLFRTAVVITAAAYERQHPRRPRSTPRSARAQPAGSAPTEGAPANEPFVPRLAAGIGATAGITPGVAPLLELSAGVAQRRWSVSVAGRYLTGTETRRSGGQGVYVRAVGARAAVAYEPWRPVRAAAAVSAYRLSGQGRGTAESLEDVAYTVGPGAELAILPIRTRSLELELALGAHAAALRPRFLIGGFGEVYRVAPLGGEALFRVVWLIR